MLLKRSVRRPERESPRRWSYVAFVLLVGVALPGCVAEVAQRPEAGKRLPQSTPTSPGPPYWVGSRTAGMVCPIHHESVELLPVPAGYRVPFGRYGIFKETEECGRLVHTYEDARGRLFPYTFDLQARPCVIEEKPTEFRAWVCQRCVEAEMAWQRAHPSDC